MEGFKILRDSRQPASAHLRARCTKADRDFFIRLEYEKGAWWFVYAWELPSPAAGADGSEEVTLTFENGLYRGADYACPCCQNRSIVSCGVCKRISCWDESKRFTCAHCGNTGEVTGVIQSAQAEKYLPNGKK